MKKLLIVSLLISSLSHADTVKEQSKSDLESKLEALNIPSDKVTPTVSEDKLFAVNQRYSSLRQRFEFTMFGANNFNADSHLETTMSGATMRYHFNGKWSIGARYSEYFNQLSSAGKELFKNEKLLPDTDYAVKSSEGFINFNTVYGKLRLTEKTIVYFDHYISLGYGNIQLASEETQMYSVDTGLAFWIGNNFSSRFGLKSESYTQKKVKGSENVHNMMGYAEIGYLFGEGSRL